MSISRRLLGIWVLGAILFGLVPNWPAHADPVLELRVKAAFMFNFARFVEWPDGKLASENSNIVFCARAESPMAPVLEAVLNGKTIDGHQLTVRRVSSVEQFQRCDEAYIDGAMGAQEAESILSAMAGSHVLSVYEADHTLRDGVVRFYLKDGSVRFEVNIAAARREHLQLSSRLLSVATVVQE